MALAITVGALAAVGAIVLRGDTPVELGDVLVFLTARQGEDRLRTWIGSL